MSDRRIFTQLEKRIVLDIKKKWVKYVLRWEYYSLKFLLLNVHSIHDLSATQVIGLLNEGEVSADYEDM